MTLSRAAARPGGRPVPAPVSPLGRLGSWSYRHRRAVAAAWLLILVLVSVAGRAAGSRFKDDLNAGTATQSQQAAAFLQAHFPGQAGDVAQVVFQTRAPVTAPAVRSRITRTLAGLAGLPHVVGVLSPFGPGGASQLSRAGHIAYGVVRFDGTGDAIPAGAIRRVIARAQAAAAPGFAVQLGGAPVQQVEKPQFGRSEALGILAAVVILLLAFSMDYQVFLISKIREEWTAGAGDSAAVTRGLASTGRVITSAAAIMICVFAAFVLGDLRVLRVIGLGMAVAVLLDATVVRMVLMPAVLQLMGRANWWFPGRLDRTIPRFLSEVPAAAGPAQPATATEGIR